MSGVMILFAFTMSLVIDLVGKKFNPEEKSGLPEEQGQMSSREQKV